MSVLSSGCDSNLANLDKQHYSTDDKAAHALLYFPALCVVYITIGVSCLLFTCNVGQCESLSHGSYRYAHAFSF